MKPFILAFLTIWLVSGCSSTSGKAKRWKHTQKRPHKTWAHSKHKRPAPPPQTRISRPVPAAETQTFLSPEPSAPPRPQNGDRPMPWPTRVHPKDGATMVYVQSGETLVGQGDEPEGVLQAGGARFTRLPGFYIDRVEVTVRRFQKFKPAYDERAYTDGERCPDCPAMGIDWRHAAGYCQWAGKRLPTEAEWTAAARGRGNTPWPWGNDFLPERANILGKEDGAVFAARVGSYPKGASPAGALDMIGNVWEWVSTAYRLSSDASGETRILRMVKGGGWASRENAARIAFRNVVKPDLKNPTFGFRCAWSPGAEADPKTPRTLTRK